MDSYLVLKLVHIVSATVLAGTGFGIAFFMFTVCRSGNVQAIAETTRKVVLADWLFTAPAIVIQLLTGIRLMQVLGYSFSSPWFHATVSLYLLIGACWIPAVIIQYRVRAMAVALLPDGVPGRGFRAWTMAWTCLGVLGFAGIMLLFCLMVLKPLPVN